MSGIRRKVVHKQSAGVGAQGAWKIRGGIKMLAVDERVLDGEDEVLRSWTHEAESTMSENTKCLKRLPYNTSPFFKASASQRKLAKGL